LLLHVALQEGQTFFEVVQPGVHDRQDGGGGLRGQDSANIRLFHRPTARAGRFGDCMPTGFIV
jgi:hypothetical protein